MDTLPPELLSRVLGHCAAERPTPLAGTAAWLAGELGGYDNDMPGGGGTVRGRPWVQPVHRESVCPPGTPGAAGGALHGAPFQLRVPRVFEVHN